MRLSIAALATLAVALTSLSVASAEKSSAQTAVLHQFLDDATGRTIDVIQGEGDHDFDDDDEIKVVRRSRKHAHGARNAKKGKKNRSSTHTSKGPDHGARMITPKTKITWYASHDLKNPQCGNGDWNPDNGSHIGAVMAGWKDGPACGEFVQLCNEKMSGKPCLRVRIVDKCAGCKADHVDLTQSAFKQLAPSHSLDEGVVDDLRLYKTDKPQPWSVSLFGPLKLQ